MSDIELKISAETQEALNSIESFSTKSISAFKAFGAAAVAYLGGKAILGTFESFVDAALESEEAVNNLNISLASAGTFSEEASNSMQKFAQSMQETTGISDELILNQIAIARNFTKTNEQAQKLTQAAVQLSAATGKDLNTSVEILGKSIEGIGSGINKTIPATKGFTEAQLKAGAAVDFVLQRFGGVAEAKFQSFGGAITGTKNAFGDMLEVIGDLIIKNPVVIALIQGMGKVFNFLADTVKKNQGFLSEMVTKGLKVFAAIIPKIISFINVLVKALGVVVFILSKVIDLVLILVETFLELKPIRMLINGIVMVLTSVGISVANVVDGILFLISKLPGASTAFKKLGINIDDIRGSVDDLRNGMIESFGSDFSDDAIDGFKKFKGVVKDATGSIIDGLGNTSNLLTEVGNITDENSKKIQAMGTAQEDSSRRAIQALNGNAKQFRNLQNELDTIKKKAEEAFKNPFNFIVKTIFEKASKVSERFKEVLADVQTWIANHPVVIETVAAAAGVLNSIFKSGAGGAKIIEEELLKAVESAQAQLDAAISEINSQREEAVAKIETDFSSSLGGLQKDLESGAITQVEYQQKINDLEEKRSEDIKSENKKAADKIKEERVRSEKEIAKLREDHQKKLNDLQEKNIQAAAKVAGEIANAIAAMYGLPPIFGEILQMLAAPPEVWEGIIDGLADGIPLLIDRILENIPRIADKLAERMPDVALAYANAMIDIYTNPKYIERIISGSIEGAKRAGTVFFNAINDSMSRLLNGFNRVGEIISQAARYLFQSIVDAVNSFTRGLSGSNGLGVRIETPLGEIKLAQGGLVPSGFPNDTFPASLTSGELVIPRGDTERLSQFLDRQEAESQSVGLLSQLKQFATNSSQSITINLQVGEKELAQVMLDLNRRGFRTS